MIKGRNPLKRPRPIFAITFSRSRFSALEIEVWKTHARMNRSGLIKVIGTPSVSRKQISLVNNSRVQQTKTSVRNHVGCLLRGGASGRLTFHSPVRRVLTATDVFTCHIYMELFRCTRLEKQ